MKNHFLWLRCLSWFQAWIEIHAFSSCAHLQLISYGQMFRHKQPPSPDEKHLSQNQHSSCRLYQRSTFLMRMNFLSLHAEQKGLASQMKQDNRFLDTNDSNLYPKRLTTKSAKSLQSCRILCDPIDGSPPGFPVPGILQARKLEWVAISFSNA